MTDDVMSIDQLAKEIVARVKAGDEALHNSEVARTKADNFYISAGQMLKDLKLRRPTKVSWPKWVREKCDLSQQRADELIRIADGKTTVSEVRQKNKERNKEFRGARKRYDRRTAKGRAADDAAAAAPEPMSRDIDPEPKADIPDNNASILIRFSSLVLELKRFAAMPDRFLKTSISAGELEAVANFLRELAEAKAPKSKAA